MTSKDESPGESADPHFRVDLPREPVLIAKVARVLEKSAQWRALAILRANVVNDDRLPWGFRADQLLRLDLALAGSMGSKALAAMAVEASLRGALWRSIVDRAVGSKAWNILTEVVRHFAKADAGLPEKVAHHLHRKGQYDCLMNLVNGVEISGWNAVKVDLSRMEALEEAGLADAADAIEASLRGQLQVDSARVTATSTTSTLMFRNVALLEVLVKCVGLVVERQGVATIHVAAVSTGEEAYSLLIALDQAGLSQKARITASDVDGSLIKRAGAGVVSVSSASTIPPNYRDAYFTKQRDQRLRLRKEYLAGIDFRICDLMSPGDGRDRWDLVIVNNLMVHFPVANKRTLLRTLAAMTRSDGIICIGGDTNLGIEDVLQTLGLVPISARAREIYNGWRIQRHAWYLNPRPYWALPPYRGPTGIRFATVFAFGESSARRIDDAVGREMHQA